MNIEAKLFTDIIELKKEKLKNNFKYLILTTEETPFNLDYLESSNIEYYGAIFPKLIYKNRLYKKAILLFELSKEVELNFIESMKDYDGCKKLNRHSLIALFDGFSNHNLSFIEKVYGDIKINSSILGGGAGCFNEPDRSMFFHNGKFYKDSAILVFFNQKINLGVGLGLSSFDGPFLATKTSGKVLKEIDYSNAFDFYANLIKKETGKDITPETFYEVAKDYPIGIVKHNKDTVIRDFVGLNENNELVLAGDIEENSVFNILKFKSKEIKKSTLQACHDANIKNSDFTFVFDCVSRFDSLEDEYENQISTIYENSNKKLFGVLCIGEIANKENKYIDFLNKSCVIGGLCR